MNRNTDEGVWVTSIKKCAAHSDCLNSNQIPECSATTGLCVSCTSNSKCNSIFGSSSPYCSSSSGKCVECLASSACSVATKPICDAT